VNERKRSRAELCESDDVAEADDCLMCPSDTCCLADFEVYLPIVWLCFPLLLLTLSCLFGVEKDDVLSGLNDEGAPGLAATVAGAFEGVRKLLEERRLRNPDDPPEPFDEPNERENAPPGYCLFDPEVERGMICGATVKPVPSFVGDEIGGKNAASSSA
jgi:hypothetical protein